MMRDMNEVNSQSFPRVKESKTSGHRFKVSRERSEQDQIGNTFTHRVIYTWNKLPQEVVQAGTVTTKDPIAYICYRIFGYNI